MPATRPCGGVERTIRCPLCGSRAWPHGWMPESAAFAAGRRNVFRPRCGGGGISEARVHAVGTRFIAWVPGATSVETQALIPCGFDMVTSSSWAWDFRAGWLTDETRRLTALGRLLAMPELPFGPRVAASSPAPGPACRRALAFAAAYGQDWLMPMGYEFGARAPLHPAMVIRPDLTRFGSGQSSTFAPR